MGSICRFPIWKNPYWDLTNPYFAILFDLIIMPYYPNWGITVKDNHRYFGQ